MDNALTFAAYPFIFTLVVGGFLFAGILATRAIVEWGNKTANQK